MAGKRTGVTRFSGCCRDAGRGDYKLAEYVVEYATMTVQTCPRSRGGYLGRAHVGDANAAILLTSVEAATMAAFVSVVVGGVIIASR